MPDYLTLVEFKEAMRIETGHEDAYCVSLLDAAESYLGDVDNGVLGRPVLQAAFTEYYDGFDSIALCHPDTATITVITYSDENETAQTLGTIYRLEHGRLILLDGEAWPEKTGTITVEYTAGWETAPAPIMAAGYFMAGSLYENRQAEGALPAALQKTIALMLAGYKRTSI